MLVLASSLACWRWRVYHIVYHKGWEMFWASLLACVLAVFLPRSLTCAVTCVPPLVLLSKNVSILHICWQSIWHSMGHNTSIWHTFRFACIWHIFSILPSKNSVILSGVWRCLASILAFYLVVFMLAFYLECILTFYLAVEVWRCPL